MPLLSREQLIPEYFITIMQEPARRPAGGIDAGQSRTYSILLKALHAVYRQVSCHYLRYDSIEAIEIV